MVLIFLGVFMEIDFKAYEEYLDIRRSKRRFVTKDTQISQNDIEKIRKLLENYSKTEVFECIRTGSDDGLSHKFMTEVICSNCGLKYNIPIKRQALLDYITTGKFICDNCKFEEKQRNKAKVVDYVKQRSDNTDTYIKLYLNTNNSWNSNVNPTQKFKEIAYADIDRDRVKFHILQMDYYDFLATPYWKAVSQYKRYKAKYKCELCNSNGSLAVHHKTYENHGLEVYHLEDLVVLCKDCHEKFHDIVRS